MCDYCLWIEGILAKIKSVAKIGRQEPQTNAVIIIHGPAGDIPWNIRETILEEVRKKLRKYSVKAIDIADVKNTAIMAYEQLLEGRSSLDVVEEAICLMESKKYLNPALNLDDELFADAAIMSTDYRAGAVGAVYRVKHPISLARNVLENARHVLVVDGETEEHALSEPLQHSAWNEFSQFVKEPTREEQYINSVTSNSFLSIEDIIANKYSQKNAESDELLRERTKQLEFDGFNTSPESKSLLPLQINGVGVVASDHTQTLTSGNSTIRESVVSNGSIRAIGSIIGCGIYVDQNACCSVSGGDMPIYSYAPARKIVRRLLNNVGMSGSAAIEVELNNFVKETGARDIGAVALNLNGEVSISFKTPHFPWAYCSKNYLYYGCQQNDKFSKVIKTENKKKLLNCTCLL